VPANRLLPETLTVRTPKTGQGEWPSTCPVINNKLSSGKIMPVTAKKIGDKWRVVEASTMKITKNNAGTAVDGGGHPTKKKAAAQASAINASESSK